MANLTNFAEWDPGVTRVEQIEGEGPGPDAAYDVTVKGMRTPLRYRTTIFEPPRSIVALAESRFLTSLDTITVEDDGEGFDSAGTQSGLGLKGMAERVQALNGQFTIENKDRGVRICATLPRADAREMEDA